MSSYSAVPRIQLNRDGTITLEVSVYGFETGNLVEIFGQASQTNGAVAPFYKVMKMPVHKDEESASITLDRIPIITPNTSNRSNTSDTFEEELPITVVARAADAWITILGPGKFRSEAIPPIDPDKSQAVWGETGYGPAVSPARRSPGPRSSRR
jgi:hypothetical protein